jgi:hypothetical protein
MFVVMMQGIYLLLVFWAVCCEAQQCALFILRQNCRASVDALDTRRARLQVFFIVFCSRVSVLCTSTYTGGCALGAIKVCTPTYFFLLTHFLAMCHCVRNRQYACHMQCEQVTSTTALNAHNTTLITAWFAIRVSRPSTGSVSMETVRSRRCAFVKCCALGNAAYPLRCARNAHRLRQQLRAMRTIQR